MSRHQAVPGYVFNVMINSKSFLNALEDKWVQGYDLKHFGEHIHSIEITSLFWKGIAAIFENRPTVHLKLSKYLLKILLRKFWP